MILAFLHSLVLIFRCPWDVYGILLYAGLVLALFKTFRTRGPLFWVCVCGLVFAFLWRSETSVSSPRYYNIFLFPAILFGVYFIFRGPWPRKIAWLLFAGIVLGSLAKDFRGNPYEGKILDLYQKVNADSRDFSSPLGISFTEQFAREKYYTNLPLCRNDRQTDWKNIMDGLRGNLSVYQGDYDAVYGFVEAPANIAAPERQIETLMPAGITVLGNSYTNRRKKEKLFVFRYTPPKERPQEADAAGGTLLPNGDFSKVLPPDKTRAVLTRLRAMSSRFNDENILLPESWGFYQSLNIRTNSFASILKKDGGNVLYWEAGNSYLVVLSPKFDLSKERRLTFQIAANQTSYLQLSLEVAGKGQGLYPLLTLRLKPGKKGIYSIVLPARAGSTGGNLWFWLQKGKIELSDARIE